MNLLGLLSALGSKEMALLTRLIILANRFRDDPRKENFAAICRENGATEEEIETLWDALVILLTRYASSA